ncbi:MAG: Gfo/Idh/MocA family oxidoreductase [Clostridia bacterium]|nr:Gfo/Idh/MocA family oxidoreductase [Clostridia bacterium]
MKQFTVAIIGVGSRGGETYAMYQKKFPERMKIVAIAEPREDHRELAKRLWDLTDEQCYVDADSLLAQPKLADVCIIATPDDTHVAIALKALDLGYHLLLEKPISPSKEEVIALREKVNETGLTVAVCHVLRYTVFYSELRRVLQSGAIGELVNFQAIEQVGYWHQAHSFVRGNWRTGTPMILQKCCHDMDILLFLIGKRCLRLSSFGGLYEFRADRAPEGAALRCMDGCACKDDCPYDAEKIYITNTATGIANGQTYPTEVLVTEPTVERVYEAIKTGPYGRCVYHCDNDVVDHQTINMEFEDGVTGVFTMSGLTEFPCRQIKLMGTRGQIDANMDTGLIHVTPHGKPMYTIDVHDLTDDFDGHGGGDHLMMSGLFDAIEGTCTDLRTDINVSVESHLMCFAAEESRLNGGKVIEL